ncbi:MAG: hypothetical protein IKB25_09095 [Lentisphaeria bacterium]|nr:hypothetical protein [Lentisphaeria bacterium]
MVKSCLSFAALAAVVGLFANQKLSDKTILRMAPMPKAPVIDGKISTDEWRYASTTYGGISPVSGLMTRRQNDFRFGYDANNIYLSITSEMPLAPQPLTSDDRVEFRFQAPGKTTPVIINFDSKGKGKIPAGVKIANRFGISLMNSEQGPCWTTEVAIPLSVFGVSAVEDGKEWKFQMMRHWSSQKETGYFHNPKYGDGMATFIPDKKSVTVSFDGFGHHMYPATGNYNWTYRVESQLNTNVHVHSNCFRSGLDGAPTLDINNPDLFGKEKRIRIGYSVLAEKGISKYFELYMMAQFPGKPRCLYSQIVANDRKTVYYQRLMFWDTSIAQRAATYKDSVGYPYLSSAFYPSYGNKLRVAATFNKKLPIGYAEINVRDSKGKVLHTFKKSAFGNPLNDFEDQTVLKNLPLGDYTVTMDTIALDGRKFSHQRTFSIRKFAWQGLNLGKDRVIIPPFKPLKHSSWKKEVHALMTGYKIGEGIWSKVYAEGENILAAPIQLFLDGKPVKAGKIKLISEEKDRVVYEMTSQTGKVNFRITQDYDYDGFCKLTVKVIPQGTVKVKSFDLRVPVKDEYVKYYMTLDANRKRALGKPDWTVQKGQGELSLASGLRYKGRIQNYFWFGDGRKGISWIIDTQKGFTLDKNTYPYKFIREGKTVTYIQQMVNVPTEWDKPWEFEMGFSPTPVKPQAMGYRSISQNMYDYPTAKGSVAAGIMNITQWPLSYYYPINMFPNGDDTYWKTILASRGKQVTEAQRKKWAADYYARHKDWLLKNAPLMDHSRFKRHLLDRRAYSDDYFLIYHNPAYYSKRWAEAEMYKAEWLPWDYPVDDAHNEYIACQTPEYIDKLMWEMQTQIKYGFDGMNFDCFPLGGGFNTVSMKAFREKPGHVPIINNANMLQIASPGIRSAKNLFGWRELMKRTAHLLYVNNRLVFGVPWVEVHSTNATVPSVAAFCSTVITTECASKGGHYFDRFPDSYTLSDLVGAASGVIPRPIFSTHSTTVSVPEQIKTLISFSFAYALMNHVDQGIARGYKEYQTMRDEVFSFGYGRPENKTIAFYDREKQPVTCNAENIRTTQVIRPDGKALLMVGNLGGKVKAKFDLSGLNYKKFKITDVFTGKVLSTPEIEVDTRGYALLKIEKIN